MVHRPQVLSPASEVGLGPPSRFASSEGLSIDVVSQFESPISFLAGADQLHISSRWPLSPPLKSRPASLWDRRHVGLLVSVAFASLLTSWLKRGVLTLLKREMHLLEYQQDAAEKLLMLPWSCSFVLGFFSDAFPIRGSHRKAYMVLGWMLTSAALASMAILQRCGVNSTGVVNSHVFLLGAACFGEIMSVVMAEAYVIALSKREALVDRGHVVAIFLLLQLSCESLGQAANYIVIWRYESFATLAWVAPVLAVYALLPIPALLLAFDDSEPVNNKNAEPLMEQLHDELIDLTTGNIETTKWWRASFESAESVAERPKRTVDQVAWTTYHTVKAHWLTVWHTLESRATWSIFRFLCLFIFFTELTLRYAFLVLDDWCGMTGVTNAETDIMSEVMYVVAVVVWRLRFINRSWKVLAAIALFGVFVVPQFVYFTLVLFVPSLRQATVVYSMVKALRGFLRGTILVLEIAAIVEIAPSGAEGAVLGTLASVATIMRLVAATVSDMIGYLFGSQVLLARTVGRSSNGSGGKLYDYEADEVWIVFTALVLCSAIRLLAGTGLLVMPQQKLELMAMRDTEGRQRRSYPWWVVGVLGSALAVSTVYNSSSVTPGTACLRAFGGPGCK